MKRFIKRLLGINAIDKLEELKQKGFRPGINFNMRHDCIIDFSHAWHIEIGDDVTLAPRVHILAHDASTWHYLGHSKVKNVKIGNRVFIGAGSIILPGITIGNDVIVGAGSVVTKDIPDNAIVAGNPAKFLMNTDIYIQQEKEKMNADNCFGREFSDGQISETQKKLLKQKAQQHGTIFTE